MNTAPISCSSATKPIVAWWSGAKARPSSRLRPRPGCGNGVIEDGEECDGQVSGDKSCEDLGYGAGELACDDACMIDSSYNFV